MEGEREGVREREREGEMEGEIERERGNSNETMCKAYLLQMCKNGFAGAGLDSQPTQSSLGTSDFTRPQIQRYTHTQTHTQRHTQTHPQRHTRTQTHTQMHTNIQSTYTTHH